VMSRGGDFYEVVEERAVEVEYINQLGLVFDVNPEQVAVGGMAQPSDPKDPSSGWKAGGESSEEEEPAKQEPAEETEKEMTEEEGP